MLNVSVDSDSDEGIIRSYSSSRGNGSVLASVHGSNNNHNGRLVNVEVEGQDELERDLTELLEMEERENNINRERRS